MRVIQTFCSFDQEISRSKFGWYSSYAHLVSWSLSAHSLSRFYDVTLYTDERGYDVLIDKLQLPYANVIVSHDDIHRYNKSAWALAKLKTFGMQEQPFLHVDGDVFIRKPFDEKLLGSEVIVQNIEVSSDKYERNLNNAKNHLRYLPLIMHPDIKRGDLCSYNAGIIGGSDLDLFNELARLAFAIANKNEINKLSRNTLLNVNVLLEQVMLRRLIIQRNKKAACLFDQVYQDFGYTEKDIANFDESYIHLVGGHKRSKKTCLRMEAMLSEQFPEAHKAVTSLHAQKQSTFFLLSA